MNGPTNVAFTVPTELQSVKIPCMNYQLISSQICCFIAVFFYFPLSFRYLSMEKTKLYVG